MENTLIDDLRFVWPFVRSGIALLIYLRSYAGGSNSTIRTDGMFNAYHDAEYFLGELKYELSRVGEKEA